MKASGVKASRRRIRGEDDLLDARAKPINKSGWATLMREIVKRDLFDLDITGAMNNERAPVRCVFPENHKRGDRSPSAVVVFYDNGFTGFQCHACGQQRGVLALGVAIGYAKDEKDAASKLKRAGLVVPDGTANDNGTRYAGLRCVADVKRTKTDWFMRNYIPANALTVIQGDGGIGKSTVVLDFIARASQGREMPNGWRPFEEPAVSIIIAAEDSDGEIGKRLDAAGANKQLIHLWDDEFDLPDSVSKLEEAIRESGARIVYIDALFSSFAEKLDPNKDEQARRALDPLRDLALSARTTVIATRHVKKGEANTANHKGMGSVGISNVARSVLSFARHPSDDCCLISVAKQNYGSNPPSLKYNVVGEDISLDDGTESVAKIHWLGTDMSTADEALSGKIGKGELAREAILKRIDGNNSFNKSDIAEKVGCHEDTVNRAMAALETDGYAFKPYKTGFNGDWRVKVTSRPGSIAAMA